MNKPPPPDKEDLAFFKEAMSDVKCTKSFPIKGKSKKNNGKLGKAELINFKDKIRIKYTYLFLTRLS